MLKFTLVYIIIIIAILFLSSAFGVLETAALVLAIIALLPFSISVFAYYYLAPKIFYQIGSKKKETNEKYIYEMMLSITCKKGSCILKEFMIAGSTGVIPVMSSASGGGFDYISVLEEVDFNPAVKLGTSNYNLFSNSAIVYPVAFESDDDKSSFTIHMFADIAIDPMKLGVLSVFPVNFNYRYSAKVKLDFTNLDRQEGELSRYYKGLP